MSEAVDILPNYEYEMDLLPNYDEIDRLPNYDEDF